LVRNLKAVYEGRIGVAFPYQEAEVGGEFLQAASENEMSSAAKSRVVRFIDPPQRKSVKRW
jgi:hypothetical protein